MHHAKGKDIRGIVHLFDAILALETEDECSRFLDDLCTIAELQALSQRIEVVRMLDSHAKYHEISERTGASTATISRVNRCLMYGAGGYRLVLDKQKKDEDE